MRVLAPVMGLILGLVSASPTWSVEAENAALGDEIEQIKDEVLDLNRELFLLEEELLFPANTQVAVYLSMDTGNFFGLDSVQLSIDDKEVAKYLYTDREVQALYRGGVHRVYMGNLKAGDHELVAVFTGVGPHGRDYRRATSVEFDKGLGARFLELSITDSGASLQPEFSVRLWE
ncbi:MAG: AraC family transcriptional regulator [Gammaproteobacteria bacterium]